MSTPIDPRRFRDALSCFATGVTIVTARDADGEPVGMTASSFNSVSMDPPLVLWSVTRSALSANAFKDASHWAVHVLTTDQIELSNRFATAGADKFGQSDWTNSADQVPLLDGCVACFECRAWACYDGGDHWILVGEVQKIHRDRGESLVFCGGSYATSEPVRARRSETASEPGLHDDPVEELLMYQLSRATRQMSQRFHDKVRESGLTVQEWRVLASLHGPSTRELEDLSIRTFIDPMTLNDVVHAMEEEGLCTVSSKFGPPTVSGTAKGHDRVSHLFKVGEVLERSALKSTDPDDAIRLKHLLRQIVRNTDS